MNEIVISGLIKKSILLLKCGNQLKKMYFNMKMMFVRCLMFVQVCDLKHQKRSIIKSQSADILILDWTVMLTPHATYLHTMLPSHYRQSRKASITLHVSEPWRNTMPPVSLWCQITS